MDEESRSREAPSFGALLRRLRLARGLTQEELADRAGLSARGISDLERGIHARTRPETLTLLADALGLDDGERAQLDDLRHRIPPQHTRDSSDPPRPVEPNARQPSPRHNLPIQLSSFVGRERELAELTHRLGGSPGRARLLTLSGAGGCGKSRLALQVGASLVTAYRDGVWLVELSPLANPELVIASVAATLGIQNPARQPVLAHLVATLRARRLLLILDNCEHLLDACAHLADAILRGCPQVGILATSREALGISGEIRWHVPSLSLPAFDERGAPVALTDSEAVQLFVERAAAVQPGFTLTEQNAAFVARICHRLDGIPLAIELAAARIRVLSTEQIVVRLDDRFRLLTGGSRTALRRHQTLHALVDWSYDLLTEAERVLLRRLAVFVGGWTLEAAEAICVDTGVDCRQDGDRHFVISHDDVLDLLTSLVDKSLVLVDAREEETRYRFLETIRQYAEERLRESGEAVAVRTRHRDYHLEIAGRAAPELEGPDQTSWLVRLDAEHDNLRAALAWCQACEDAEAQLRLAGALGQFWNIRGYAREGLAWLDNALAREGEISLRTRVIALEVAGNLEQFGGDLRQARERLEEAVRLARGLSDPRLLSRSLRRLAMTLHNLGDIDLARYRTLLEESLAVARASDYKKEVAYTLCILGSALAREGEEAAWGLLEESVRVGRESGDASPVGNALANLGRLALDRGDYAKAHTYLMESLSIGRALKSKNLTILPLWGLADVARGQGNLSEAWEWCRAGLIVAREIGQGVQIVVSLGRAAGLCVVTGRVNRAARLFGADAAISTTLGFQRPSRFEARTYRGDLAATREALNGGAFARAWAEGQAMTLEQAVTYALEEDGR